MGVDIAWLLPAAVICLRCRSSFITRRAPRTDPTRAAALIWGGWLVVTAVVFSFMNGIVHPYYTVALAPAIAASGRHRRNAVVAATVPTFRAATALSGIVLVSSILACVLLARDRRVAAVAAVQRSRSGESRPRRCCLSSGRLTTAVARSVACRGSRGVPGGARRVLGGDGRHSAPRRDPVGGPGAVTASMPLGPAVCLTAPTPGPGADCDAGRRRRRTTPGRPPASARTTRRATNWPAAHR